MQIIVPMSGFGERFKRAGYSVPKPLIEVSGRPIIEHVVSLFPGERDIIFICNEEHLAEPRFRLRETLERACPDGRIVSIPPHGMGPVHAVMQASDIVRDDEPVIVNYCDFACYWDYAHFTRFVAESGCDGAIPSYRGFHPHSLGSTYYAYVRESGGWISAIQEKQPFTDAPMQEYASSGTYYFRSGAMMKAAFAEVVERGLQVNGEHYVSLAYIPLLEQSRRVAVYELQHFMQWGTPQDLGEYEQHDRAFRALRWGGRTPRHDGALLIPMAGAGSRFVQAGYADPKPLVSVSATPMAVVATDTLPDAPARVFVLRRDMERAADIERVIVERFPDAHVVDLNESTEGQAVTCLAGLAGVDAAAPLTISACDTGLRYSADRFDEIMRDERTDVIVWGFRGHGAARRRPQAYGWVDAEGDVVRRISVKEPLANPASDPVVVGTFTFRRADQFRLAAERLIARNGRVNGEFYVDSCINDAIDLGLSVRLFEVDAYLCWGTPEELQTFEYWQSCFHKWAGHPYTLSDDALVPLDAVTALERRYAPVRPLLPLRDG